MISQTQSTWKASVSACEDMKAQLVIINNAEEQVRQTRFLSGPGPEDRSTESLLLLSSAL